MHVSVRESCLFICIRIRTSDTITTFAINPLISLIIFSPRAYLNNEMYYALSSKTSWVTGKPHAHRSIPLPISAMNQITFSVAKDEHGLPSIYCNISIYHPICCHCQSRSNRYMLLRGFRTFQTVTFSAITASTCVHSPGWTGRTWLADIDLHEHVVYNKLGSTWLTTRTLRGLADDHIALRDFQARPWGSQNASSLTRPNANRIRDSFSETSWVFKSIEAPGKLFPSNLPLGVLVHPESLHQDTNRLEAWDKQQHIAFWNDLRIFYNLRFKMCVNVLILIKSVLVAPRVSASF